MFLRKEKLNDRRRNKITLYNSSNITILQYWNINNIRMEYKTPSKKSCDYALFYNNKLLAIVEAKNINC